MAGRLVGVRFRPPFGPKEGIEIVPPRRETPIRPGEDGYTGNPHTDFRIEPDPYLSVRDDLERRDFTVNAMARDIRSDEWIDPFGGREDLAARILRAVHPSAFRDDPLRILRGIARRGRDGLVPEPETLALMREVAPRIAGLSAERVRETLDQTIGGAVRRRRAAARPRRRRAPGRASGVGGVRRRGADVGDAGVHGRRAHPARPRSGGAARRLARAPARGALARRGQAVRRGAGQPLREERRARRSRDAPAGLRQRHAARGRAARARALLRRGVRSDAAERTALPRARRARRRAGPARASPLRPARSWVSADRGRPPPARPLRGARRRRSGRARSRAPSSPSRATTCWQRGCPGGPSLGRVLAALLAAVVDDPARNTRDELLRLAAELA